MDNNTLLLVINLILQIIAILDHSIFQRLKKSNCIFGSIELQDNKQITDNKL